MIEIDKIIRNIERRKKINQTKIDKLKGKHGDYPCDKYTYYSGWDLGYYEGYNRGLELLLDEIEGGRKNKEE